MAWLLLIIAGLLETVWAVGMKYSEGFTRLWPSLLVIVAMALSVYLLALSLQTLPLGTAYSIWTGIGAVGAVIYGILFFSESKDILKILFVMMIIGGIIGLKLTTSDKPQNKQQETTENIGN